MNLLEFFGAGLLLISLAGFIHLFFFRKNNDGETTFTSGAKGIVLKSKAPLAALAFCSLLGGLFITGQVPEIPGMAMSAKGAKALREVKGQVLDANGKPVPGAMVVAFEDANTTTTSSDGSFRFFIPANGAASIVRLMTTAPGTDCRPDQSHVDQAEGPVSYAPVLQNCGKE